MIFAKGFGQALMRAIMKWPARWAWRAQEAGQRSGVGDVVY